MSVSSYRDAFYRIANVLGIPAQPDSPASVIASQMLPAIKMLVAERDALAAKLNTPQLHNFSEAVTLEAAHQRERWGNDHDAGKTPADWFWLLGYLAGKALHAHTSGNVEKALHHTISSAAALVNWHAAICGEHTAMRPGIEPLDRDDG